MKNIIFRYLMDFLLSDTIAIHNQIRMICPNAIRILPVHGLLMQLSLQPLILFQFPSGASFAGLPLQHLSYQAQKHLLVLSLKTSFPLFQRVTFWYRDPSGEVT